MILPADSIRLEWNFNQDETIEDAVRNQNKDSQTTVVRVRVDWKLSFCRTAASLHWQRWPRGECIRSGLCVCFCGRLWQWTSGRLADWLPMVFFMIRSIATCNEPLVSAEESTTRAASHTHLLGTLVHWRAIHLSWLHIQMWPLTDFGQVWVRGCAALEYLLGGVIYASTLIQSLQECLPSVDPLSASSLWHLRRIERCLVNTRHRHAILHVFKEGARGENPMELILLGNPRQCKATSNTCVELGFMWWEAGRQWLRRASSRFNDKNKRKVGPLCMNLHSRPVSVWVISTPPPPHVCVCVPTTNRHVKHLPLRCHCLQVKGHFHIAQR